MNYLAPAPSINDWTDCPCCEERYHFERPCDCWWSEDNEEEKCDEHR